MQRIAVIDYGMGNLRSVSKAVEHVAPNDSVLVTSDANVIKEADRIICPGQGAAADCMQALQDHGLVNVIKEVSQSRPFFGICMGHDGVRLKVPHMGWSAVARDDAAQGQHPMWEGIENNTRFYFAHSYYCVPTHDAQVAAHTEYGHKIAVALAAENVFACQFHPEKSSASGLKLLENFIGWKG